DGVEVTATIADEAPRRSKGRTHDDLCPRIPPIGRAIYKVGAHVSPAATLVHTCHEEGAVGGAAGELHVTNEASGQEDPRRPVNPVVRKGDRKAGAGREIVPGDIHATIKRAGWIVVHPH